MQIRARLGTTAFLLLATAMCAAAQSQDDTPSLDSRIDPSQITELPVPEAPKDLIQPTPPVHRIATDRNATTLNENHWASANEALRRGLAYLATTQARSGAWFEGTDVIATDQPPRAAAAAAAVTGLAVKAFAQAPELVPNSTTLDNAVAFLRRSVENNGFPGLANAGLGNYVTSSIVMGLAAVGSDTPQLREGIQWLQSEQWDTTEGIQPAQDWYGGAGYGNRGRPDLSNTQMMLDALYDAGVSPEEPTVQRALVFLTRTQNLKSTNPAAWAQAGSDDGGFIYTPANDGESMASQAAGEGRYGEKIPAGEPRSLRSYGSMTYAGFKSLLYAGLQEDDPRVKAALGWVKNNYTFKENPGLGQQGYYYYLHAMARALRASGLDTITDSSGATHDWRSELIDALVSPQREDGSWINTQERWEEARPELATIYSVLALEEALKPTHEVE